MYVLPSPTELPISGAVAHERADAARNRLRILAAAESLVAERGVSCVSMEAIAIAAGVGKGTLFRRFGDRSSLMHALLDERERSFQEAFIRGPAPLGPGAPARDRLIAFGEATLENLELNGDLLVAAESEGARLRHTVYSVHHAHVAGLVREAAPRLDADYAAHLLLAGLSARLVLHQRRTLQWPSERLRRGWAELIARLTA
jgi:AcrR family transcriptional regulator